MDLGNIPGFSSPMDGQWVYQGKDFEGDIPSESKATSDSFDSILDEKVLFNNSSGGEEGLKEVNQEQTVLEFMDSVESEPNTSKEENLNSAPELTLMALAPAIVIKNPLLDNLDKMSASFFMQENPIFKGGVSSQPSQGFIKSYQDFFIDPYIEGKTEKGISNENFQSPINKEVDSGVYQSNLFNDDSLQGMTLVDEKKIVTPIKTEEDQSIVKATETQRSRAFELEGSQSHFGSQLIEKGLDGKMSNPQLAEPSQMGDANPEDSVKYSTLLSAFGDKSMGDSSSENFKKNSNSLILKDSLDLKKLEEMDKDEIKYQEVVSLEGGSKAVESKQPLNLLKNDIDNRVNFEKIESTSQILIEKGGGVARIQLSPEGLGTIDLKLKVNGDQVSIELVTSNSDTKELFEKSAQELQDILNDQKLKLDSLKVTLSDQKLDSQMFNSKQQNSDNPHLAMMRDLMNQSRQESFSRQGQGFIEMDEIKSYGRKSTAVDPIKSHEVTPRRLIQGDGRGRRLSLVG